MKKNLDKKDLISLVKGTSPHPSIMNDDLLMFCGQFTGFPNEKWEWGSLRKLSEETLWNIYDMCKRSWEEK